MLLGTACENRAKLGTSWMQGTPPPLNLALTAAEDDTEVALKRGPYNPASFRFLFNKICLTSLRPSWTQLDWGPTDRVLFMRIDSVKILLLWEKHS